MKKIISTIAAMALITSSALSHTNSIGYVGDGNGGLNFWYGSWHNNTQFNEAEIKILRPDGTVSIDAFNLLEQDSPAGLLSGVNYFASDGTQLVPYDPNTPHPMGMPNESYTWQGLNYQSLATGTYTFTYIPLGDPESNLPGSPTADWMPMDEVIRSLTINLTQGDLDGDANLNGILDINEVLSGQAAAPVVTIVSTSAGTPIVSISSVVGATTSSAATTHNVEEDDTNQTLETTVTTTYVTPTTTTTCTTPTTVTMYSDNTSTTTNGPQSCTNDTTTSSTSTSTINEVSGDIDQMATLTDMSKSFGRQVRFDSVNVIRADNEYKNGMKGDTKGFTTGFKTVTDTGAIVGFGVGRIDTKINDNVDFGSFESDIVSATVGKQLQNVNMEIQLIHLNNDYSYDRTIGSYEHSADTKGTDTTVSATITGRNKTLQPVIGVARAKHSVKGYTETGSVITARTVSSVKEYDTYGILGAKLNLGPAYLEAVRYTDGVENIGIGLSKRNERTEFNIGIQRKDTKLGETDLINVRFTHKW